MDGLRTLAVLPVILFHAGFSAFSGGFVGVDVFFVISGYLITSIILKDLELSRFSVMEFYERRARRILPALFLVLGVTVPFAWMLLPAGEMKGYADSLAATSLFASNILFFRESGYFDTAAELKPLLHTWSLAVEEQYYLFFPLFLAMAWRFGRRVVVLLIVCGALLSFVLAQWAVYHKPAAAFYILPTRAWELLLGAMAALYLARRHAVPASDSVSALVSAVGIALIAVPVVTFSKGTPFPGVYALAPTCGALLIILFATPHHAVGRLLGSRPLVGVGLISYSAYLWHQPLLVFGRHAGYVEPGSAFGLALAILSLVLAFLSWKYIEAPFRDRKRMSRGAIFGMSTAGLSFFLILGIFGHLRDGFGTGQSFVAPPTGIQTDRRFIVLGDSHAAHLLPGLKSISSGAVDGYASSGCIPFRNVDRYDSRSAPGNCVSKINRALDQILASDPDAYIVLSSMGPVYIDGSPFKGKDVARVTGLGVELITDRSIKDRRKIFEVGLRSTLRELTSLRNPRVIVALDIPELGIDYGCTRRGKQLEIGGLVLRDLVEAAFSGECSVSRKEYDDRARDYKALVTRVVSEFPAVQLFDPTPHFCDESICRGFDPQYGYLYQDVDHLSVSGSRYYATKLIDFLRR